MRERIYNFLCWLILLCCAGILGTIILTEMVRRFYWGAQ